MFDSMHSEKNSRRASRRASPTYATLQLAQSPSISTEYLKDLYHLLPPSNIFYSLPFGDVRTQESGYSSLTLLSMASPLGSLA